MKYIIRFSKSRVLFLKFGRIAEIEDKFLGKRLILNLRLYALSTELSNNI